MYEGLHELERQAKQAGTDYLIALLRKNFADKAEIQQRLKDATDDLRQNILHGEAARLVLRNRGVDLSMYEREWHSTTVAGGQSEELPHPDAMPGLEQAG